MRALRETHAEMDTHWLTPASPWQSVQLFDAVYLPASGLAAAGPCLAVRVDVGLCALETGDPLTPFQRYQLARQSLRVCGDVEPPPAPSRAELAAGTQWLLDLLRRPATAHSPIMRAGLLQETARLLCFWTAGDYPSKRAALERLGRANPDWAVARTLAAAVRERGSAHAAVLAQELEAVLDRLARPARNQLIASMPRPSGREDGTWTVHS